MSNVLEFEARATVERQAREWLVRLDGDHPLTDAEREDLQKWMEHHPAHREELRRLAHFWNQANVLTELAVPLNRVPEKPSPSGARRYPLFFATACVLVVSTAFGIWHFRNGGDSSNGTYETAIGQVQTIPLQDGSTIRLNTDSQVQVDYHDSVREIHLLRGEALFSVSHDSRRPFAVYAAETMVTAVGTAFSVNVAGGAVAVTVTKGVVDVAETGTGPKVGEADSGKAAPVFHRLGALKAGETATLRAPTTGIEVQRLADSELNRRMTWQEGYLVFSGEHLSEVVAQVNRYSSVKLEIEDPRLASIAIGGRFRIGDLDAVLDVLRTNFDIQFSQIDEHSIRLEAAHRR